MRPISREPAAPRFSLRPFLAGAVVLALAVAGLVMLSEAFASGGQTVYLANIQPGGNEFPTQPSIVVTGSGGASAPAERAVIQLLIVRGAPYSRDFAGEKPVAESGGTVVPVIDAIEATGVEEGSLTVVSSPALISVCSSSPECSAARIEISVDHPTLARLNEIINAAGEAAGLEELTVHDVGAGYYVADCHSLHDRAREGAAADARARAKAQAAVLGVDLGALVVSSEVSLPEPDDAAGCAPVRGSVSDAWWTPGSVGLTVPSFDPQAEPAVTVELQMTLAFAIGDENDARAAGP